MTIYIAGKIEGDPDYRTKFERAGEELERQGHIVLNPARLPQGLSPGDYMRICLAMMDTADAVAFLPDYRTSRGALLEWSWCQYVGKQTYFVRDLADQLNATAMEG